MSSDISEKSTKRPAARPASADARTHLGLAPEGKRENLQASLAISLPPNLSARRIFVNAGLPTAHDASPATENEPLATITAAARLAQPGDTVCIAPGTYRECVRPERGGRPDHPIRFLALKPGTVSIRGSDVIQPDQWTPIPHHPNLFSTPLPIDPTLAPHPFTTPAFRDPTGRTLGQVFLSHQPLRQVGSPADLHRLPMSWYFSPATRLLTLHLPDQHPSDFLVEWTSRSQIFVPASAGLGHIHLIGLHFEQCANQFPSGFWRAPDDGCSLQAGAVSTRSGHHWLIERCTIRHATSIGLDCGAEGGWDHRQVSRDSNRQRFADIGHHRIQNNVISDNGACGIAGAGQTGTVILANTVERNNRLGWTAPEVAGIKVHFFYQGLISGNLIRDNDAHGIWLDNEWYGSRVAYNTCLNNVGSGIFIELGEGHCMVDHNICAFTRCGDGIYLHDTSGATVAHNLLYANSHFGIYARQVTFRPLQNSQGDRSTAACMNNRFIFNLIIDNYRGHICLPPSMHPTAIDNSSDYNHYVSGSQWQWEGASPHQFVLGGSTLPPIPSAPIPQYSPSEPPHTGARLDLPAWLRLTGNDSHSTANVVGHGELEDGAIKRGAIALSARDCWLDTTLELPLSHPHHPDLSTITTDFTGHPIGPMAFPGPVQDLGRPGSTRLIFWPVPLACPVPLTRAALDSPAASTF